MRFKNGPLHHSKLLGTLWSVSLSLVPDDSSLPLSPLRTQPKNSKIESNQNLTRKRKGDKRKLKTRLTRQQREAVPPGGVLAGGRPGAALLRRRAAALPLAFPFRRGGRRRGRCSGSFGGRVRNALHGTPEQQIHDQNPSESEPNSPELERPEGDEPRALTAAMEACA